MIFNNSVYSNEFKTKNVKKFKIKIKHLKNIKTKV